jgi:hypothetical protein
MDAIETLREEVQQGRIGLERLVDLIAAQQRQLLAAQQQLQAARERIEELEKKLGGPPPTTKVDEPFSVRSEEQRQEARGKKRQRKAKGRRGRFKTKDKIAQAERTEPVFPEGIAPNQCYLSHVRPVWRLENGRAVRIAYQIYRGPNSQYGQSPGVLGRSEFGLEIVTEIVKGRPKPASDGRLKTGHFEETTLRRVDSSVYPTERGLRWRIGSRWQWWTRYNGC